MRNYVITNSGTVKGGVPVGDPPKIARGLHFNLKDLTEADFFRERKDLIRWTKQLYNKDAREVRPEEDEAAELRNFNRHFCLEEADIQRMQAQTAEQVFECRRQYNEQLQELAQSPLPFQRAAELPSPFIMSMREQPKRFTDEKAREREATKERNRRNLAIIARISLQQKQLDEMTSEQVLDRRSKQARKANKEWKWEFRRQQNLLKK